ncbi:MAG: GNAT family N-acetyltransferase [Actinomycetota bacterium]|nr:GNAT family N-acetyltransferase [Actinomycetota bacterium]
MVAERPAGLVGYALVSLAEGPSGWDYGERVADVETLAVAPEARGQGVGTQLMDAVERELLERGVRAFRVLVIARNDDARRFYERRGMVPVSHVLLGRVAKA